MKWYDKTLITILLSWGLILGSYFTNESFLASKLNTKILTESLKTEIIVNNLHKQNEVEYSNTLKRIAENIYRTDSFLGFGGSGDYLDYDKEDQLASILESSSMFDKYLEDVNNFFDERTVYFDHIPNIFPVAFSKYNRLTSPFGDRINPVTGEVKPHMGIDIGSVYHADIVATADGVIKDNWIWHPIFGRMIIVDHGNGYTTVYAHLSKSNVHEGQHVKRGEKIGEMGSSGVSFGEHIHYEVRKDKIAVDPIPFMRGYIKEEDEPTEEI